MDKEIAAVLAGAIKCPVQEEGPELSDKMAMKIGKEDRFESVYPRHFEKLAEGAGFGKALTRQRVPELAQSVLGKVDTVVRVTSGL